jgi:hypothetical protein
MATPVAAIPPEGTVQTEGVNDWKDTANPDVGGRPEVFDIADWFAGQRRKCDRLGALRHREGHTDGRGRGPVGVARLGRLRRATADGDQGERGSGAVPESVQTDGVSEVKLTGKPEVAAAPIVYWSPTFSAAGPFRV